MLEKVLPILISVLGSGGNLDLATRCLLYYNSIMDVYEFLQAHF